MTSEPFADAAQVEMAFDELDGSLPDFRRGRLKLLYDARLAALSPLAEIEYALVLELGAVVTRRGAPHPA